MLTCANCGRESPDEFAFCPACASPLVPDVPSREVRKTVSVVFCDVTGSTALGERLDPESLREVQTRYFDAMRRAVERHGGTVEKYIGDAVMAVFGIPTLHEDDALRAARAAMDMRVGLAELNEDLEHDLEVSIAVRIGVNTGEVVAGDAGPGQALVTGDAVNVAARLEQHALPGDILLGETTYHLVRDAVEAEPIEPLAAKGKSAPVPAFRLLLVHGLPSVSRRTDTPHVGRLRHLSQLHQAYEAAVTDSTCQLFTVLGPAGVGKSRLVEEFLAGVDDAAVVLRGRCLSYGEGITYFPVIDAIRQAASLADFDPPEVVEAKICSALQGDEHQDAVCRHVAQLLGVTDSAGGEETFWAIRRFFEAAARRRPLILVFDDIHWAETTFLDLVEHIADWARGSPLLLLCMARQDLLEARPFWGGGKPNAVSVSLEPLSVEESHHLIAGLVGGAPLSEDITGPLVETAEGNPLFIESTIAMLVDDGAIERRDEGWVAVRELSSIAVPASIQALLAARVDRLDPPERDVIEAAAVTGKDFFAGSIRALLTDAEDVHGTLMALARKELIRPQASSIPGEEAFSFRHLLIRDSAYEALPKARRADLHERFADWLERRAGESVAGQEEIVAFHLERAYRYRSELGPLDEHAEGLARRASTRFASAGRRACDRGDFVAGATLLRQAVTIAPDDTQGRARLLLDLAEAAAMALDAPTTLASAHEAEKAADDEGEVLIGWSARLLRMNAQSVVDPRGISTGAIGRELEAALEVFTEHGDERGVGLTWIQIAELDWNSCRFDRATVNARRGLEHARRSGDRRLVARAVGTIIGAGFLGTATPQQGQAMLDELSADLSVSMPLESLALLARGVFRGYDGAYDEAASLFDRSVAIAEALGNAAMMIGRDEMLGDLQLRRGDAEGAVRSFRRQYEALLAMGNLGNASTGAANLARALSTLGRFDEAESFATIAREMAAEDDLSSQIGGRGAQARILAARGDVGHAEALAAEAVEMALATEAPNMQGDAWIDLARVRLAAGIGDAEMAAREALACYERKGTRPSAEEARSFLDALAS